jgi:hypothetical protein
MMTQTIVHFVFSPSGAGNLRRALKAAGRNDQVVLTWHNLNFGPIDPSHPEERSKWLERELGWPKPEDRSPSPRDWDDSRFPNHRKVAWFTRRSADEFAGFLDWLWHRGDTPLDVIDLSEVWVFPTPPQEPFLVTSLGSLHDKHIWHKKLWDLAKPLPMEERLQYRQTWERLIAENAPLRVLERGKLVSAKASYFDSRLMDLNTDDWQLFSRIIGTAMAHELDDEVINTDFEWLQHRLMTLVERGDLEILEARSREERHLTQVRLVRTPTLVPERYRSRPDG